MPRPAYHHADRLAVPPRHTPSPPSLCILSLRTFADFHLAGDTQCFPLHTYGVDGSNRRDNITDWALAQFRSQYSVDVTKQDIFDYVYGMLHHPQYRVRYSENLKHELPRIPLLPARAEFDVLRQTGAALAKLHVGYETAPEYKLAWRFNQIVQMNWRVTKMKLSPDKQSIIYNEWLTLDGIPPEAFEYRLGNRSALEWVIEQYQVSTDAGGTVVSDPNRLGSDDEQQYIARLVCKVTHVSVETVRLVREMAAKVDVLAAIGIAETVEA
ncbi:MAG: type ISP restriction/modification enzyme [Ktedonobacterales bacterium]